MSLNSNLKVDVTGQSPKKSISFGEMNSELNDENDSLVKEFVLEQGN